MTLVEIQRQITHYKTKEVREFIWSICSNPIWEDEYSLPNSLLEKMEFECLGLAREMDENPSEFLRFMSEGLSQKLGHYFERLYLWYFMQSSLFELQHHSLQVIKNGVTQGELDFLLLEKRSGQKRHIEVAVKFYIGKGNRAQLDGWVGPGDSDYLGRKIARLQSHQLQWEAEPDNGLPADFSEYKSFQCIKGYLFQPLGMSGEQIVFPAGCTVKENESWFATTNDFLSLGDRRFYYQFIEKIDWLHPATADGTNELLSFTELSKILEAGAIELPKMLIQFEKGSGFEWVERSRGFIVAG